MIWIFSPSLTLLLLAVSTHITHSITNEHTHTHSDEQFLSSASRDRMMHVFSLGGGASYEAIQTLSDHSAAVTAVRFVRGNDGTLHLLSSGADKSLIFHSMEKVRSHDCHTIFHQVTEYMICCFRSSLKESLFFIVLIMWYPRQPYLIWILMF